MIINNRDIKVYTCYQYNISKKIINYQKMVFDNFNLPIEQEYTTLNHPEYLNSKLTSVDFDIIIFFDIDCIPLKNNIYEYIVNMIYDNNSIIGVEQSANHIDTNFIYAGPACFGITKEVYEKLGKPSFYDNKNFDCGGEITYIARNNGINVKLFNITSSLNKKWKCGNKFFGNGTIYDDLLYHQFEVGRYYKYPEEKILEYQYITKCKDILDINTMKNCYIKM